MLSCEVCGKRLVVTEIDKAEGIAWVCCPEFFQGNDEHDSYPIELTQKIEELFLQQG